MSFELTSQESSHRWPEFEPRRESVRAGCLASARSNDSLPPTRNLPQSIDLARVARILAGEADSLAAPGGSRLARRGRVVDRRLIGIRHLESGGRKIPVLLFRNGSGSVAAHCLIQPGDTPILDAPSPEAVLALAAAVIDDLLLARSFLLPQWELKRAAPSAGAGRRRHR